MKLITWFNLYGRAVTVQLMKKCIRNSIVDFPPQSACAHTHARTHARTHAHTHTHEPPCEKAIHLHGFVSIPEGRTKTLNRKRGDCGMGLVRNVFTYNLLTPI